MHISRLNMTTILNILENLLGMKIREIEASNQIHFWRGRVPSFSPQKCPMLFNILHLKVLPAIHAIHGIAMVMGSNLWKLAFKNSLYPICIEKWRLELNAAFQPLGW